MLVDHQLRDIIADRLDAGIRLGEKLEKDMIAVRVGPALKMAVVASPAYLATRPAPRTPQDLAQHRCINYRMTPSGPVFTWDLEQAGRVLDIKVSGPLTLNDPELMMMAALEGIGIAYILEGQAKPHIEAGAPGAAAGGLEDWTPPFPGYFLYYPSRRQMPPTLAAFIATLRRYCVAGEAATPLPAPSVAESAPPG